VSHQHLAFFLFLFLVELGFELRASHLVGRCQVSQFILFWAFWSWDLTNYLPKLSGNSIFPISVSQLVRITGVSHGRPAPFQNFLRQSLTVQPRLASNSPSSCLSLLSAGITGTPHHTRPWFSILMYSILMYDKTLGFKISYQDLFQQL
jgi:hypothetical protein